MQAQELTQASESEAASAELTCCRKQAPKGLCQCIIALRSRSSRRSACWQRGLLLLCPRMRRRRLRQQPLQPTALYFDTFRITPVHDACRMGCQHQSVGLRTAPLV